MPAPKPTERPQERPATPAEPPLIERPLSPTERVLPAPPLPPRSTIEAPSGPPVAPGPTVPSVAVPAIAPGAAGLGLPATAVFEIHPGATVSGEYSDNFFQTSGDRRDNFRTTLSPGLTLFINSPVTKGTIAGTFSLAHDTTNSDISVFYSLFGSVVWDATPVLSLSLSDSLTRSDESSQADRLSLRRERNTFTSNVFSAAAVYRLRSLELRPYYTLSTFFEEGGDDTISHTVGATASLAFYSTNTLSLGYAYLDSTSSDASDVKGHQVTAALSRQLSRLFTAGVSAGLALRDESGATSGLGDRFQIWNGSLFGSYTSIRFALDASIGYSVLAADDGATYSGVSTASTLTYRFGRVTAILGVDSGYSETFTLGENFGVVPTTGATASLSYSFSPALSAAAGAFYRRNDLLGVIATEEDDRREETWGATASVSFRLRSWLDLGLNYTYTDRKD
ncbi:MAG: hypothetical protein ACREM3_18460, partial [Candidatus Rokuibacteriota bacterium]